MPANISDFMSSFTKDLARPNRFEVNISIPNGLRPNPGVVLTGDGITDEDVRLLTLRCETAELPSRTFTTAEQKFGSNPIEKYPYHTIYNDLTLTFIVSGDMQEKRIFDKWMNKIMPSINFNPQYKYNNSTPNYVSTIRVTQFSLRKDEPIYQINLYDAYPISVNQMDLDWSSDSHHKLTVVFAYTYWEPVELVRDQLFIPTVDVS
jgi:hypothetical protein